MVDENKSLFLSQLDLVSYLTKNREIKVIQNTKFSKKIAKLSVTKYAKLKIAK